MTTETKPNVVKPRWSKVLSDLWDSKTRTLLVVASIAVGVFAIGVIVSAYAILAEDIDHSYASVNPVNIEIWTDPFYEDFVRIMERVPGVSDAEGRRIFGIRTKRADEAWQNLNLIATTDFNSLNINQLSTVAGTQVPGRRELLVSQDFMNNTGYLVGDEIIIELPDGSTHILPVVGIVTDQATGGSDPTAGSNAYITLDSLGSLGVSNYFNRLYITTEGDRGDENAIAEIGTVIEDKVERNNRQVYRTDINVSDQHPMGSMILALLGVLGALGILITILSSTLIINTLNALLTQQMRQIGVMKLIGGRSFQILGMYLVLIFAYGLISLIVAIPAGAATGFGLARFIASMMGAELQGFRIIPIAIVLQGLMAFIIPFGAGFFPVRKGSKTNVRRAISNDRPSNQASGLAWFNRFSKWVRWVSRPILLSIRNTFRQKGRLLLTIFTLTIGGAVFIGVFNVRASMAQYMDQLTQHFMGDVTLNFSRPYPISRIEQAVLPIPGVSSLEGWGGLSTEIWDSDDNVVENLQIIAPPTNTSLLDPEIVAGRWLEPGERQAVVVSDSIYDYYPDLQPGDEILVKVPGQREEYWSVVGVFRFTSMLGDTLGYADFDFVADLLDLPNQAFSYKVIIETHTLEAQQEISQILDQYLSDRDFMVSNVDAGMTIREDASRGINILVIFLLIMALLTAFVGSIGLTGTMGMNVLERTREIGVMRAIGAVDLEIIKSVVIEGVLIGLITWVLAIGLSFPISYALLRIISESMMGSVMNIAFTTQGMVIWLAVVVVLSFVASILPARNAARLTIREVLAYE
ncbi:MAG: FtsX-like permease family protein [Anaerolineales bacterium]|nr:FtsX-like permease family protein [Anaerolineales bacterium]